MSKCPRFATLCRPFDKLRERHRPSGRRIRFASGYCKACHSERSEESPVYSIGRAAEAFTSPFARTLRLPRGSHSNDSVGVRVMDPYRG